jgi:hypothetical protein
MTKYNWYVVALLTIFAGAVFAGWFVTMTKSAGKCDINHYGEGWIETATAGLFFLLGIFELRQ